MCCEDVIDYRIQSFKSLKEIILQILYSFDSSVVVVVVVVDLRFLCPPCLLNAPAKSCIGEEVPEAVAPSMTLPSSSHKRKEGRRRTKGSKDKFGAKESRSCVSGQKLNQ